MPEHAELDVHLPQVHVSARASTVLAVFWAVAVVLIGAAMHYHQESPFDHPLHPLDDHFPSSWNILAVTDLDKRSLMPDAVSWRSYLQHGVLHRRAEQDWSIVWGTNYTIVSETATRGRAMELSELVLWRNMLLAMCDITGIVYKIKLPSLPSQSTGVVFPRWALATGDGHHPRAFKSEWATTKDGQLFVGSLGKEWIEGGVIRSRDVEWVKTIDDTGHVKNLNWIRHYDALRAAANATSPGYLSHEAVIWHPRRRRWLFFPRKVSGDTPYTDKDDETLGGNIMLVATEDFSSIQVVPFGPRDVESGFTSAKLLPHTDIIVLLRVKEIGSLQRSWLTVIHMDGRVLMPLTLIGDLKYEGLAILEPHAKYEGLGAIQ